MSNKERLMNDDGGAALKITFGIAAKHSVFGYCLSALANAKPIVECCAPKLIPAIGAKTH